MSVEVLVRRRGGFRSRVTVISNELSDILSASDPDLGRIRILHEELSHFHDTLEKLNDEILDSLDTDEKISKEIELSSQCRLNIRSNLNAAKLLLSRSESSNSFANKSVKLPNIHLKTFDGNPIEFPSFWDLFKTSIHDRKDIAPPAKFHYLISQLRGDALNLLSGFDHTESEYSEAVDLLSKTYGKPKLLVQSRLHALLDLKSPNPTAEDLSRFRAAFEGHLRALKSLQCNINDGGYIYAAILMRKLPRTTFDNINRANASVDVWKLEDFRTAIEIEINNVRAAENTAKDKYSNVDHTAAFHVSSNVDKVDRKFNMKCHFCLENSHYSSNCVKYPNSESRNSRARSLHLCFNCLNSKHSISNCSSTKNCRECKGRHHTSLCYKTRNSEKNAQSSTTANVNAEEGDPHDRAEVSMTVLSNCSQGNDNSSGKGNILPTAKIQILSCGTKVETTALFDICSQKTFITKKCANLLQAKSNAKIDLTVDGFGSQGKKRSYEIVSIVIPTNEDSVRIDAVVIDELPSRIVMLGRSDVVKKLKSNGYNLADPTDNSDLYFNVDLLIGVDNYFKFIHAQKIDEDLFMLPSKLGPLIAGNTPGISVMSTNAVTTVLRISADQINDDIERLWKLDSIGINDQNDHSKDPSLKIFQESLHYENGKYSVSLPWKHSPKMLPSNYKLAMGCLHSNLDQLRKNPDHLSCYDRIIREQLTSDFIEVVHENNHYDNVHYLAHHSVKKDSVTTPIRIVFNCSAKHDKYSKSLNDCLYSGPPLLNELSVLLLRFRTGNFAVTADIAKAFLQVGLDVGDRDFTRFLWPQDPFDPNSKIIVYRFKRILFGSTCSQFLLNATLIHHLQNENSRFSDKILKDIYVDNLVSTFDSESDLVEFFSSACSILKKAGFELREWDTNNSSLEEIISFSGKKNSSSKCKIFGTSWDTGNDTLNIPLPIMSDVSITKRQIVSDLAKIYDPLGTLLPVTITGKILIQDLWKLNLGWDETIPPEIIQQWKKFVSDINELRSYTIDRKVVSHNEKYDLHIFSDASTRAFGAACYVVTQTKSTLIYAKSRVAPIKEKTLPQLELTAVNLAVRIGCYVGNAMKPIGLPGKIIIWCDSQITLNWLNNDRHPTQYVTQRIQNIRSLLPECSFRFVQGNKNPSDLLTRGVSCKLFLKHNEFWTKGPCDVIFNPATDDVISCSLNVTEPETNLSISDLNNCQVSSRLANEKLIDLERFNSYNQLIRTWAYVMRFISHMKDRTKRSECKSTLLNAEDFAVAEMSMVKCLQLEHFSHELDLFHSKSSKRTSMMKSLNLFLDGEVLLCGGRLGNAQLSKNTKYPILLPSCSHFSNLLIKKIHEENCHTGINDTVSILRCNWWIPKARTRVKSVLRKCVKCLKTYGKPYAKPVEPHLPADRVTQAKPFSIIGVDYTAPINVRDTANNYVKVYIVLFTCAVTRALHLEVAEDATETEFLNAFRRFVGRRSFPSIIYSDNAKIFISANQTLKQIAESNLVVNYFANRKISWKFIPARAPWFGGMYERLIGITKDLLKRIVGKAILTLKDFRTILVEIESRINNRPLTYYYSDLNEPEPLTPSHLITGYRSDYLDFGIEQEEIMDSDYNCPDNMRLKLGKLQQILHSYWNRWHSDYLLSLRERSCISGANGKIPKLGDVVIIHDEKPRVTWKLGIIVDLFHGSDSQIRSALIRTMNGNITRPVVKLYPMEVNSNIHQEIVNSAELTGNDINVRPLRIAALKARQAICNQLNGT